LALRHLLNGGASARLNLGTGQGYSVREVVHAIESLSGRPVPARETSRRPGDPPVLVVNPARGMQLLGWRPMHSNLETIVKTGWRWHEAQDGRQR